MKWIHTYSKGICDTTRNGTRLFEFQFTDVNHYTTSKDTTMVFPSGHLYRYLSGTAIKLREDEMPH